MDAVFVEVDAILQSDLITKIMDDETLEQIMDDISECTILTLIPIAASADAMWSKR